MTDLFTENPPFGVKLIRFASGERVAAVVDAAGMLTHVPNVYGMSVLRSRECASATMEAHLNAVVLALNWSVARRIDMIARTSSLEMLSPEEITDLRDALRLKRRKAPQGRKAVVGYIRPTVLSGAFYNRCHMVRGYFAWLAARAIQRIRPDDPKHLEARWRLEQFNKAMVENLPKPKPSRRVGPDDAEQALFLEVIRPDDPRNPFKKEHRQRNYALLRLFYETGIRRGEALKLKGEHLFLSGDNLRVVIARDPDDPHDPRKVEPRVKTYPREVPISADLARSLTDWTFTHRKDQSRYSRVNRISYVFVSRTGRPLGVRTVNNMFSLLSAKVASPDKPLSPHLLRHAAVVRFAEAVAKKGLDEAAKKQLRNYIFGWSKNSNQGDHYEDSHTRREAERVMRSMHEASIEGRNR